MKHKKFFLLIKVSAFPVYPDSEDIFPQIT